MSKISAVQFFEKARGNERVVEILKTKDKEETTKLLAEIATEMGEDISAEDFAEAMEELEVALRQRTQKAVSDMEALEDDDLENVAGGTDDDDDCWMVDEGGWYYCSKNSYDRPI